MVAVDEPRETRSPGETGAQPPESDSGAVAASVGARLAAARTGARMSVEEVSARTRIRAGLIRQMEDNDFSAVGGAVYARGHIRSIARVVGIDPEPLVAAFDGEEGSPAAMLTPAGSFDPLRRRERRGARRWYLAMIVSLVVICLLALYALLRPSGPPASGAAARTSAATASASPTHPAAAAPASTAPAVPVTEVTLRMAAVGGESWLQVDDETNRTLLQQTLAAGTTQTVTGQALRVRIGNAGAMRLTCNGKDLGALGGPGQVVTVQVGLADGGACSVSAGR